MALGGSFEVDDAGGPDEIVRSRPVLTPSAAAGEGLRTPPSFRQHFTLSGAFGASHPYVIVAGRAIKLTAKGNFEKFSVQIRNAAVAHIAFDREVSTGDYDDLHPGNARLDDRNELATYMSILFPVVPVDPVEVTFYAGRYAQPI